MLTAGVLPDLAVIVAQGADAAPFLQGQLTQDIAATRTDTTVLAGWADPRGRLQWAGHLWATPDGGFGLLAPRDLATDLATALRRFVLRARVSLDVAAATPVAMPRGEAPPREGQVLAVGGDDSRQLWIASPDATPPGRPPAGGAANGADGTTNAWRLADVRAGLPVVTAATRGEFVPQMVNLDLVGGISFSKGCYPGQEIVARTRFLGRVKRRMLRYSTTGSAPAPGSAVRTTGGPAGQVVVSAQAGDGAELLAVVVLESLPGPLELPDGRALTPLPLPYPVPELPGN